MRKYLKNLLKEASREMQGEYMKDVEKDVSVESRVDRLTKEVSDLRCVVNALITHLKLHVHKVHQSNGGYVAKEIGPVGDGSLNARTMTAG